MIQRLGISLLVIHVSLRTLKVDLTDLWSSGRRRSLPRRFIVTDIDPPDQTDVGQASRYHQFALVIVRCDHVGLISYLGTIARIESGGGKDARTSLASVHYACMRGNPSIKVWKRKSKDAHTSSTVLEPFTTCPM